ncbi:TPA: hypothetical protein P2K63_000105 [Aeromonas salmonicida]|nr:hypothetical protein [Aeromonas sp. D3]HDN9374621.1 hypothetical protein [Aeromonas salmonicida]HDN9378930.1 hypothetical protein [Aeromonas salmonicida]HDN9389824.1 hypothetical protein [Aeromonas salmonicida]HDN9411734.1 hypothetical protein [Aeromonas salmonicida]HDN9421107.1 hypothetical protein [Aeromonas salmonicida]
MVAAEAGVASWELVARADASGNRRPANPIWIVNKEPKADGHAAEREACG